MKIFLIQIFVFISTLAFSQSISLGLAAADNLSFTSVKTDKELISDISYSPLPGYSFGIVATKELSSKLKAWTGLYLDRRRDLDKTQIEFRDDFGSSMGSLPYRRIINQYLKTELNLGYKIEEKFVIGTGVNIHTLLSSKTKINELNKNNKYKNYHYRTISFSIPIYASYSFYRFNARLIFDKGIISRMKDSSSDIKEIENSLTFQLTYFFIGEKLK